MTSSSGTSSGSSALLPGSKAAIIDQKKQKRMLSNRESARRSRMRKQKHLDDLRTEVCQLRQQHGLILAALNHTTKQCLDVETQNSVLRTQMVELTSRLHSLNEILHFLNGDFGSGHGLLACEGPQIADGFGGNPWNSVYMNQPIMDDPWTQASQLRQQHGCILADLNHTTKQYLDVETQNSVLRTQMVELTSRLHSLNEISIS